MKKFIIQTTDLVKKYDFGGQKALNGLNMQVKEGIVYGLLGKNGAGKSTVLRIFMGLLKHTSGNAEIMGFSPEKLPLGIRQQIGYTSDSMQLIPWLKVSDLLNYNGSFFENWDTDYVKQWCEKLSLDLNQRVFQLSRGNRQKLGLVMAIGHRPKLLILDEPAGGLDPHARKEFLESLIELIHESGTTIIISSHQLSDLERISDYIGIIDQGKMKLEMNLEDLKKSTKLIKIYGQEKLEKVKLPELIKVEDLPNSFVGILPNYSPDTIEKIKRNLTNSTLEIEPMNLEEIFLAYTR